MKRYQPSFTARIARSFLVLAMLMVSMVGTVAYIIGQNALENAAYSGLDTTAKLKEKEITRWLESCEEDFLLIAEFPTVREDIQQLLSQPTDTEAYQSAYQRLSLYFQELAKFKPKFTELSIRNRANQIILSTDPKLEGTYKISANLTEIESIVAGEKFAPLFYVSPDHGRPAITYASTIYDEAGSRQGVILADLNLKRIDDIISAHTGLDQTAKTYLVGSLANQTAFISQQDSGEAFPEGPHSKGIDSAFMGKDGSDSYLNHMGEPVLGVYLWLTDQDVALLAEISKTEAFAPARKLAATITLVGLGAAGILLLGVSRLARQLSLSRKKIESYSRQLEKTATAANTANQAKSEFLANMSHELRTPLNAILGFTQLMQRESDRFSVHKEYLGIVSRSGEHLLNLINDVLSMAKIEAGRTTFDPTGFDLRYLLLTLEEMLRMKADAKALQLYVEVGETVPQFIKTDEIKLRQVLVNLMGNAIKFTQSGHIALTVSADQNNRIFFSVQDTGPGISPDELKHLFDPFYQASRTRKTQQGTGLGLSISRRFVGLMGGELTVESTLGQGSTFAFSIQSLPTHPDELPKLPLGEVVSIANGQPQYRILVVEDIFSSRQLLVELLSLAGFDVRSVANGKEAIACYKAWHPHLIWMDMRMPVMDGYEATRQIRTLETTGLESVTSKSESIETVFTKIIAITASAFEEEREAVMASGCNDFVRKPFATHVIFEKMAEHLGVQYRYKNDPVATTAHESSHGGVMLGSQLEPEDLAVMSADWRAQFHQAALSVDAEHLHQLIRQIPPEHSHLAATLSTFTRNFCFDELIALTEIYA